jgi:hypothetical protein
MSEIQTFTKPELTRECLAQTVNDRNDERMKMKACVDVIRRTQVLYMDAYLREESATAEIDALLGEYVEDLQLESD